MSEQVKRFSGQELMLEAGMLDFEFVRDADHDRALSAERAKVEEVVAQIEPLLEYARQFGGTGLDEPFERIRELLSSIQSTAPREDK